MRQSGNTDGSETQFISTVVPEIADALKSGVPAIRYAHVSKVFETGGDRVTAVDDVDVSIPHQEFVMLVGSSGGGKTTLLKMANGLVRPTSGDVFYYSENLRDVDLVQLRRKMGYAIQGSMLFPHLDVERNIAYVPKLHGFSKEQIGHSVSQALALVGLDSSLLHKYPQELSGGQQQRVGIARALAADPYVLLMDEPFGAVDEITRRTLQEEIARIYREQKLTILFVTHDINEALRLGTMLLIMNEGIVQQYATPEEVLSDPANSYVEELVSEARGSTVTSLTRN